MAYEKSSKSVKMLDFDQIKIGDEAELSHLIEQRDVDTFASLTGDFNPLHIDEEYAKRTLFHKPVVHGMLSASFISTMIGMMLPGVGALWASQTIQFLRPAYVGDKLRVVAKVKQKSIATRLLVLNIVITNQHGEELITGEAVVKNLEVKAEVKPMNGTTQTNVLITGSSKGIGAATAVKLASDGYRVIINYLKDQDKAESLVAQIVKSGGQAIALKADVTDLESVKNMFTAAEKAYGPIQNVVHCAGPENAPQPFEKLDWKAFQDQIDVHLKGAFNCAKTSLPGMVEAKSGNLIFIGTIYTDGVPPAQQARYITAKAALSSLSRCLAVEYGPMGIRVNLVSPGMTQTEMISQIPDKVKMLTKMQTPLRRLADPEDIANTIAFLLSPAAKHMTGETLRVCGGAVME